MLTFTPDHRPLFLRRREAARNVAARPADPRARAVAETIRTSLDEFVRERSGQLKHWRQRRD